MNPGLRKTYLQTAYVVRAPQGVHALRIGVCHPAFDAELSAAGVNCWSFITAWNPGSRPVDTEENARAQGELVRVVAELGLQAWPAEGRADSGGWREESLCVLELDAASAVAMGRRFGQLAVVVGQVGGAAQLLAVAAA